MEEVFFVSGIKNIVPWTYFVSDLNGEKISGSFYETDYDKKITEIENKLNNHNHDKFITTPVFNTLVADVFNARLAQANLITKTD